LNPVGVIILFFIGIRRGAAKLLKAVGHFNESKEVGAGSGRALSAAKPP
jgi:hypothetical protein